MKIFHSPHTDVFAELLRNLAKTLVSIAFPRIPLRGNIRCGHPLEPWISMHSTRIFNNFRNIFSKDRGSQAKVMDFRKIFNPIRGISAASFSLNFLVIQGCVPVRSRRPLGCAPSAMPTKSVCRCGCEKLNVVAGTWYGIVPKFS